MKIAQVTLKTLSAADTQLAALQQINPNLLLVFGSISHFSDPDFFPALRSAFPAATLLGCSTAGEISEAGVSDQTTVLTALRFEQTRVQAVSVDLISMEHSAQAGKALAQKLNADGLKAVIVFGQGVRINGSALIEGMSDVLGPAVTITGGLAGDDGAFSRTAVLSDAGISTNTVAAIGLYGEQLLFRHGSQGGWRPFGPVRKITRCSGNLLYELDGKPALDIYKQYLGEYAKDLPGSGLLFPFEMLSGARESLGQIRTILGIDEHNGSLILAGNINDDGYLRLMHAHTDDLVDGAETAAKTAAADLSPDAPVLALLVSCIGRKLVMGGRVEEEVEAVQEVAGQHAVLCGFYSNGEISPAATGKPSCLHNQTMTITCLAELDH